MGRSRGGRIPGWVPDDWLAEDGLMDQLRAAFGNPKFDVAGVLWSLRAALADPTFASARKMGPLTREETTARAEFLAEGLRQRLALLDPPGGDTPSDPVRSR